MQGITIAIGKQGVEFFIEHYLSALFVKKLHEIKANKSIFVGPDPQQNWGAQLRDNSDMWLGSYDNGAAQLWVNLQNGYMDKFAPAYKGSEQKANGCFDLSFTAKDFDMVYDWYESYWHQYREPYYDIPGDILYEQISNKSCGKFTVKMAQLDVTLTAQLAFNQQSNAWEATFKEASVPTAKHADGTTTPATSWVTYSAHCLSNHISQQADGAIKDIDFVTLIKQVMFDIVASIPGSGHLTKEIIYDFSLGDPPLNEQSALCFPNDDGIKISVHGGASYKNETFSPKYPLPNLPFPAVPLDSDSHHLTMYVSNYEIDALYWAYFKAGLLDFTVNAGDKSYSESLSVNTYIPMQKALEDYQDLLMRAQLTQQNAPVTAFRQVYELTPSVLKDLGTKLPSDDYKHVLHLAGRAFATQESLEKALNKKNTKVSADSIKKVESASRCSGMVVEHDMDFILKILTDNTPYPDIQFNVKRTDVLTELGLGIDDTSKKQTLKFKSFMNAEHTVTYKSSTVPDFDSYPEKLAGLWNTVGEHEYDEVMKNLGATGTPLPILDKLQFDFDAAVVTIQDPYVMIAANVKYTG